MADSITTVGVPATDPSAAYRRVRARTLALCEGLGEGDLTPQSMTEASPGKWHLGHTTWFFETFLLAGRAGYQPFDPAFAVLFNSYYQAIGAPYERSQRGLLTRPELARVLAYRAQVDAAMEALLADASPAEQGLVVLGCAHEEQHQELMVTDLLHLFSHNPLAPGLPALSDRARLPPVAATWRSFPRTIAEIGHDGDGFAFDNESPRHAVVLAPYAIAERPVTCGEFQAFVEAGGYREPAWWMDEGWAVAQAGGWTGPGYWRPEGTRFGPDGLVPRWADEPVRHLSWYEADAYARWAGARLPTEAEWEHAMLHGLEGSGHGWEWTGSAYRPYPGYQPVAGAVGEYNGKFMCNQFVLRGYSPATAPGHSRPTYRNFFPAQTRWQFTALRLAEDRS